MDLKGSNMRNSLLSWPIFAVLVSNVFGQEDVKLLRLAKEGFEARLNAGGLANKESCVSAFRKPFEGLEDSQRIRALALYLYNIDQSDSKWSMSASISMGPTYALRDDPDFIKDWSFLRQMLRHENDPRKFYLLSGLVPLTKEEPQHDFIAERTHMLFADGRVAKDEGEYTRDYADDVSEYAYAAIVGNLRVRGADFVPPSGDLPHEEQAKILAKWLKENWTGCEGLEIPEPREKRAEKRNQRVETSFLPTAETSKKKIRVKTRGGQATGKSRWLWLVGGAIILAVIFFRVRTRR